MSSLDYPAQSVQNRMLFLGTRNGPAECFLRRTLSLGLSFEAGEVTELQEADRTELALRVFRDGRMGLAGGSLPHDEVGVLNCVARAEASAASGPAETILAPAVRLVLMSEMPSLPSPSDLVARVSELHTRLCECRAGIHWSGNISVVQRIIRVTHSGGLDAWGGLTEHRLRVRARFAAGQAPVDRLLNVSAAEWPETVRELIHRVEAEFPDRENLESEPASVPLALGPSVVAQLCLALIRPSFLSESPVLDRRVSLIDEPRPGHQGCDDEGVLVQAISVVDSGFCCEPWASMGEGCRALIGRAFRPTIDSPPAPTPVSLHWVGAGVECAKRVVLLSEVAGLSAQPDGTLHGIAIEGVVLDQGRPVHRCRGRVLQLHPVRLLKELIGEITADRFAVGKHRMPQLVLA
ncbi:MAG: hypothetical protein N2255_00525 [Kiritimatiellae bacterium]|nr:hypothetical protein [Kiritimatiellia bacterium]